MEYSASRHEDNISQRQSGGRSTLLLVLSSREDQGKVCLLGKAICGLKQASRGWYIKIHVFLIDFGMIRSEANHNLYIYQANNLTLIVLICVDDLHVIGSH